ncbi:MAG: aldo/keto reductase [Candidatus Obscuribacterales bacterium]
MTSSCREQLNKFLADRFILGTAQIGMDYGIANKSGKPDYEAARLLIATALELGIDSFDTATAYGDSEAVLGRALKSLKAAGSSARTMSKLSAGEMASTEACLQTVQQSLQRLQCERLELLFAHSFASLSEAGTEDALAEVKRQGLARATGVSVYTAQEALTALEQPEVDVVQMPLNALDQQAVTASVIKAARLKRKRLIFRSIFLQGLLVMPLEQLPPHMSFAFEFLQDWHNLCQRLAVPPRVLALQCALSLSGGMQLLIGCDSAAQLRENVDALDYRSSHVDEALASTAQLAARVPEQLRNPSLWPKPEKVSS